MQGQKMISDFLFEPGRITTMKQPLRRTLVLYFNIQQKSL